MIELHHVTKHYMADGQVKVILDDQTISLPIDHNIGILGRNGSGKSSLMRMIAGIESPDSGEIIRHTSVSWPVGFSGVFNAYLTGEDNARMLARIYARDPDYVCAFCQDFSELGSYFHMPVNTYSSGMKAKLAFSACLAIDFQTYLIDEVIAVGDREFREKCLAAFRARMNCSNVIIISHSVKTLEDYADIVCLLQEGRLTTFASLEDAVKVYQP